MLELSTTAFRVIRCCGPASALAELESGDHGPAARIAPDELLLLTPAPESRRVLDELTVRLAETGAIVVDHTDAFAITKMPSTWREAIARLTAIDPPERGFFQGLVADVPCKVMLTPDHLYLLAPSTLAEHVRERVRRACAGLGRAETRPRARPSGPAGPA